MATEAQRNSENEAAGSKEAQRLLDRLHKQDATKKTARKTARRQKR